MVKMLLAHHEGVILYQYYGTYSILFCIHFTCVFLISLSLSHSLSLPQSLHPRTCMYVRQLTMYMYMNNYVYLLSSPQLSPVY